MTIERKEELSQVELIKKMVDKYNRIILSNFPKKIKIIDQLRNH